MEKQPAKINYFFDQGFKDLKGTIKDSWENNNNSAQENFEKASDYYWRSWAAFKKVFFYAAGITMYIFGSFWFLALSLLHITILFVVYCIVYFLFTFTWILDYLYRVKEKIFTPCPNPGCHEKSSLPIYLCPQCGVEHTQLWPSKYGIWKRTCKCGNKLPTTFFNGRGKLKAICPNPDCRQPINTEEGTPLIIPIIGPPYAGKSTYLYSMIDSLKKEFAEKGYEIRSNISQRLIDDSTQKLLERGSVIKTAEIDTRAVDLIISKGATKYVVYFYDVAGEAFNTAKSIEGHKFYEYFSAMIFLLDPFAVEQIRIEYYEQFENYLKKSPQTNANAYDNALGLNEVFANFKLHLAQAPYNIKDEMRVKQSLAVLIPKTDFFSDKILETDKDCRSFLAKFGQKQFVDDIIWKFKKVRFFNVISKGKDSIGVLQPFEWILKREMVKKRIRRFFGNLLMAFFITVVVGGLILGGFYAYHAVSNYFSNRPYISDSSSSRSIKFSGWSTFLLKGNASKVLYDDGRYIYFNMDGNVLKQNVRVHVRRRMGDSFARWEYEYVYSTPTRFVFKSKEESPSPYSYKIVCEGNTREEFLDDTEALGWTFSYDAKNRLVEISEPEYGFGCTTTYAYEANDTYPSKKDVEYFFDDGGGIKESFVFSNHAFDTQENWTRRFVKYQKEEETQEGKIKKTTKEYYENRSISYF